ncbi:hypothetical protein CN09_06435 [Rhizobium rhizogenes]|nr:hypothetical protein CN09_06435 [Rhizobium rhizogenes]MQB29824.1 hypothetical protein [Rhizobium rhizogenes]OCJ31042.1 hypothetical protein A6U89_01160 [Agrobacterium sp. B133/95]
MRRSVAIGLMLICGAYFLWKAQMTRAASISLEPTPYNLTYTMVWGWGMEQRFSITPIGALLSGPSSGWMDIWKEPYNSGLALYRTLDGRTYYLGLSYQLFWFHAPSEALVATCDKRNIPAYTSLGEQISKLTDYKAIEALDPGARHLFQYVETDQRGTIPKMPPNSRYYANLQYLGKFGLVGAQGRGDEVGFAPAGKAPEPRLGLDFSCG